ncbi:hypothetical protein EV2_041714 [Malus domestica]
MQALFLTVAPCSSPPKPNGFSPIWSLLRSGPLRDSELQEEADERLQELATRPVCKISRAPQDDNVMLSTSDYLSSYKFSSQRNLYYGFAFTCFHTGEASGHDKKLPGKEETAKKVKPRPEKTSNGGGTKAVDL